MRPAADSSLTPRFFSIRILQSESRTFHILAVLAFFMALLSACSDRNKSVVDKLNERAYAFHYRNTDSTMAYATKAEKLAENYADGRAEALNNKAYVLLAQMRYKEASRMLTRIFSITDNQVEQLVADVQLMRLCQRESRNKDFYEYREQAERKLQRIHEEMNQLDEHQKQRLVYAESEFHIVSSAYFYYVGLTKESVDAINAIDINGPIQLDTAQVLSYLYNIGAGGIITEKSKMEVAQEEFDYLMRCYVLSQQGGYSFWEAQAMQAISEHLQDAQQQKYLIENNKTAIVYLNRDEMPDSLLAGYLAQRAYNLFEQFGDVYQIAGANRTLAECFWQIKDYRSALICLNNALNKNKAINQAPDLVASIREQLCLVYSAVNDKQNSDRNRNIYLDLQEQTRQDRLWEARASQLDRASNQLNLMLIAVLLMIVIVIVLLFVFDRMRRKSDANFTMDRLLMPLKVWQEKTINDREKANEKYEEIEDKQKEENMLLRKNQRRNMEQRAKISLVCSVIPFIDRIVNELGKLRNRKESEEERKQRFQYIGELTDVINDYNNVLTRWIQMRQGEVRLKIETFPLQELFDIVKKGRMGFKLKGIDLKVEDSEAWVKADKALTLFMINTIADNARKFTDKGGEVKLSAKENDSLVEVSVADTGCGMTEEQMAHIFDRTYTGGHGFGLKNCNGIIEKYKKISRIFSGCAIGAESELGKGSRIFFRLPKGTARWWLIGLLCAASFSPVSSSAAEQNAPVAARAQSAKSRSVSTAARFADSAYYSNIAGTYERTLAFSDSCHKYLNPADTVTLLDISNETAVAALALHKWDVYHKNNECYTRLFRLASADKSLPSYVRDMQRSKNNKNVAVILLVLLLIVIFPAYYLLYYRHLLYYRYCIDRINSMNKLLDSDISNSEKLKGIERLSNFKDYNLPLEQRKSLGEVVRKIRKALEDEIRQNSVQQSSIEMATDELRKTQRDSNKIYVANNVLDNCLSTLKHETMYYPSRIKQLISGYDDNIESMTEVASYYRELYGILTLQALRQLGPMKFDRNLYAEFMAILKSLNNGKQLQVEVKQSEDNKYITIDVVMTEILMDDQQRKQLFTPYTSNLDYLILRQMVREMGELTNLRACGIEASGDPLQPLVIHTIMPRQFYKIIDKENGTL